MSFVFTTQHELFIKRMLENQEQERKGFELLLSKDFFYEFFDHLLRAGLFSASRNPGPAPARDPGFVTIPYWAPLDYLLACAKHACSTGNVGLSSGVLSIVRECSDYRNSEGEPVHNYHTSRKFVAIMAALPTQLLTFSDIEFIRQWLTDPYEKGMVCKVLDDELLPKLLLSESRSDWMKAVHALDFCTQLVAGKGAEDLITVADDYWLKELMKHHMGALSVKVGREVSDIFLLRLGDLFGRENYSGLDCLYRPAVEDHAQNRDWYSAENICVEGLRDVLLGWVDADPDAALTYLGSVLVGELFIGQRVAFHVINCRWDSCKQLFMDSLSQNTFENNFCHEIYQLLKSHFSEIDGDKQNLILELIKGIKPSDDSQKSLRTAQLKWLSAIRGSGNKYADEWYDSLVEGEDAVSISSHPDFPVYSESRWGDGDSPYQSDEIVEFLRDGTLIARLNRFKQVDEWGGPTTRALVNALEATVAHYPELFLASIQQFSEAKSAYQYGLISGLKQAWSSSETQASSANWDDAWPIIIDFINDLISSDEFWSASDLPSDDWVPNKNWIPPLIAEFLRGGTRNDMHALPDILLPRALSLIKILLSKSSGLMEPGNDPMNSAINNAKGKAIEALFSHTLRTCRIADAVNNDHSICWNNVEALYSSELEKTRNGNYEFSTLVAAYLVNFEYLSLDWLSGNILRIFPLDCADNFDAAIGGLAYSNSTINTYRLLTDSGVIDHALQKYKGKALFEDKLIERVALAYLWGEEQLDSPRFVFWFKSFDYAALQVVSHFFWSVHKQEISDVQINLIVDFWRHCVDAVKDDSSSAALLSSLGRLAIYLDRIDEEDFHRLLLIAPHHRLGHNSQWFIEGLNELSLKSPEKVFNILTVALEGYQPVFDFEGQLANIARSIAKSGFKTEALCLVDSIRHLRDMDKLFDSIKEM